MQQHINIFDAKTNIDNYGIWYAIWFHGTSCYALWTIFVACRMIKHDRLQFEPQNSWHRKFLG
jgi:hypothetical protein